MRNSIILCFFFSLLLSCKNKDQSTFQKSPNIVFIFADDLGYGDIGSYGAEDISTPNIDFIAENGIKFNDFYSVSSVCTPSRAGMLTGRMPQRFGLNGVLFPDSHTGMPPSEYTIAELLKDNGYYTGIIGKWHLGHKYDFLPLQQGFDFFFGIPYSNDMASTAYFNGNDVIDYFPDQKVMTNRLTQEAISFIESNKKNKFYLYLAHPMPHVPIYASNNFIGSSNRGLYGDVIQELDWSVGEIINKLNELNLRGITDNSNDRFNNKIRKAQINKIPLMIIIGDKEVESNKFTVGLRDGSNINEIELKNFKFLSEYTGKINDDKNLSKLLKYGKV